MDARKLLERLLCLLLPACATDWEVHGVVVDEDGAPLQGVACAAIGAFFAPPDDGERPGVETDADGRFRLVVDDRFDEAVVICAVDGHVTRSFPVARGDAEARVVMVRGGAVEGTVRLDVEAMERLELRLVGDAGWEDVLLQGGIAAELDAEGRFRSSAPVPPGAASLRVLVPNLGTEPLVEVPVEVRAGETVAAPEIDLRGRLARVDVRAVDADGRSVTGFRLSAALRPGVRHHWDDADGGTGVHRMLMPTDRPPAGLRIEKEGYRWAAPEAVGDDLVARLEPAIEVEVRLAPPPALAANETLTLIATRLDVGGFAKGTVAADGRATLRFPTDGVWTLTATILDGPRGPQVSFELVEEGERRRTIDVAPGIGPIEVELAGDPLADARERIAEAIDFLH